MNETNVDILFCFVFTPQEHPGKCWVTEYNKAIDVDTHWQPEGVCQSLHCTKSSEKSSGYVIHFTGLGNVARI